MLLLFLLAGPLFGQQEPSYDLEGIVAAAGQAQAAENYVLAAANYKRAVALRPDIPELRANLGLMQHEAAQYSEAIRSFEQALRLKPSLYVPTLFLGIDYVRTNRAKDAVPLLLKAEKINPNDPLPSTTLAHVYTALGEPDLAAREFGHVLRLDPKQSAIWFDLGIAQLDIVEQDARTLTSTDVNTAYAKALYAEALVKQSRYKQATALYNEILAAADQPPCMRSDLGWAYLKQGDTRDADLTFAAERKEHPECSLSLLGQARLRIDADADQDGLALLQQVWEKDPGFFFSEVPAFLDSASPEHLQSFLTYAAQQRASAQLDGSFYRALTEPTPDVSALEASSGAAHTIPTATSQNELSVQARREYLAGHYRQCTDVLRGSLHSANAPALHMLAACSFFTGDSRLTFEAGQALQKSSASSRAQALYWSISANERLAFASLARFEQLEPNSVRSHVLLGDMYRQRRRNDDAQKEYGKALELSSNDRSALLGMASASYAVADYDKAIEFAHKALTGNPDDPDINLLMGEAMVSQHMFSRAEAFLIKGLGTKPQVLPHVHALLGQTYAAEGRTEEAIRELHAGAASDQDGSIHYQLARLYSKTGDSAAAATAVEQMKALQQSRRERATVAIQDGHPSNLDDAR